VGSTATARTDRDEETTTMLDTNQRRRRRTTGRRSTAEADRPGPPRHGRAGPSPARSATSEAVGRLRPLLDAAATLDLEDRAGWRRLRASARAATGALAAGGRLPPHLVVAPDDPPILVNRTLAAAWRQATSPANQRHHRAGP
jgi:hypothetical protein